MKRKPCYTFPASAKTAFTAAASIWANIITSAVPITIKACWANLASSTTLGYAGGAHEYKDFTNAPRTNTWYRASLANSLYGSDLGPGEFDMHITYNQNFSWYYGTDGNTPLGQYDLMTVVLHEMAHGLNFAGSMRYSGGIGNWGDGTDYPNIYDVFIRDGAGTQLINTGTYPNGSAALGSALVSNNIWFHGSEAMAANGSQRVKMYAPATWSNGSSYSHLDFTTFNNTINQLMVYAISDGESVHDPGTIVKGLLKDLGWTLSVAGIYELSVVITGKGMVTSEPTGISCGEDCSKVYDSGTIVTLTATPQRGGAFLGWSGDCGGTDLTCDVTVDQAKNVSAEFYLSFPWTMFLPAITNSESP